MSRSGYSDDCQNFAMWRGAVRSSILGKRGQQALREIAAAMDAMPEKRLVKNELEADGEFCTLGVLGQARGLDLRSVDTEDPDAVAQLFGLAPAMVKEITYLNDESVDDYFFEDYEVCGPMRNHFPDCGCHIRRRRVLDPRAAEKRWAYMRRWVACNLKTEVKS